VIPLNRTFRQGFTLIELLVVVAIIGILASMLLPVLARAKSKAQGVECVGNLKNLTHGWHMFADDHEGILLPGRFSKVSGGTKNPKNWYDVGNGLKYRPRWVAYMGKEIGQYAFKTPRTDYDRQDYDNKVYINPLRPHVKDERNYSFGYNHQFLGNARKTNSKFHKYPVHRDEIINFTDTVLGATCMGTAAGFTEAERISYENNGKSMNAFGNHGWTLDPPRLTPNSDKGTGDPGSPRTAVDPCMNGKAIVAFLDGSVVAKSPEELGYRKDTNGKYLDTSTGGSRPTNRFFSGTGEDDDPPSLPR